LPGTRVTEKPGKPERGEGNEREEGRRESGRAPMGDPDWRARVRDPLEVLLIVIALGVVFIMLARAFSIY
jgi:hypothetical protein